MSETQDPRTEISHDIHMGQVYRDDRTDERITLTYVDDECYIMRDEQGNNRFGSRRELDTNVGAGRYKLDADAEPTSRRGMLSSVLSRADEYAEMGGRKHEHFAEAMREAVDTLRDTRSADAHETVDFESLDGVGGTTASNLRTAGYKTRQDVRRAEDSTLLDIGGVGEGNLQSIRDAV